MNMIKKAITVILGILVKSIVTVIILHIIVDVFLKEINMSEFIVYCIGVIVLYVVSILYECIKNRIKTIML